MTTPHTPPVPAAPPGPGSLRELFLAFNRLALQGFGGVLPVAQRELVERRGWLDRQQFVELLAVSQVLPGPNVVNLALIFGDRWFGLRGAFAALAGMMLAPLVLVLSLTVLYTHYAHVALVGGALRGMGAVAAGLIISTALKLFPTVRRNPIGVAPALGIAGLTFLMTAWLRWPLVWVVAGLGTTAIAIAWHRLAPGASPPPAEAPSAAGNAATVTSADGEGDGSGPPLPR